VPIHIKEIRVESLGPLKNFNLNPGMVTLVYGHNEQGKTYLVEFLIRSLFKKNGFDDLRVTGTRGEVRLVGIGVDPWVCSPKNSRKLDDLITRGTGGSMPPSLSRLLVVRGGELAISHGIPGGVDRAILQEYLSNESFLDKVQANISGVIQSAQLGPNGEITGKNNGEVKTRAFLRSEIDRLDGLFARLQEAYSGGERSSLQIRLEEAREKFAQMENARRHYVWKLDQEIKALEQERARMSQEVINRFENSLNIYWEKLAFIEGHEKNLRDKESECVNYPWLVEAIEVYKSMSPDLPNRPSLFYLVGVGLALVGAIAASFLNYPYMTFIAVAIASAMGWYYLNLIRNSVARVTDVKEKDRIGNEFSDRFGIKFSGLPIMEELRKKLEPVDVAAELLKGDLEKERQTLHTCKQSIDDFFVQFLGKTFSESEWQAQMVALKSSLEKVESRLSQAQREFDRLNVDPSLFLEEDPGVKFDARSQLMLNNEVDHLIKELQDKTYALENLKQEVAIQVGDEHTTDWEVLIEKLKAKRQDLSQKYREITGRIAAGILVNGALATFRQKEDQRIQEGLQSSLVTEPLLQLTGRYTQIDLAGDQLAVSDAYGAFPLKELSTGAQEQVLLALRIGFAKKLMGQDALFLILDDAFQHSDWQRRERMVDEMISLARQNWQIIYFSMDDHIRSLFEERVRPALGEGYCYKELISSTVENTVG